MVGGVVCLLGFCLFIFFPKVSLSLSSWCSQALSSMKKAEIRNNFLVVVGFQGLARVFFLFGWLIWSSLPIKEREMEKT